VKRAWRRVNSSNLNLHQWLPRRPSWVKSMISSRVTPRLTPFTSKGDFFVSFGLVRPSLCPVPAIVFCAFRDGYGDGNRNFKRPFWLDWKVPKTALKIQSPDVAVRHASVHPVSGICPAHVSRIGPVWMKSLDSSHAPFIARHVVPRITLHLPSTRPISPRPQRVPPTPHDSLDGGGG
jgi:hypothetical protein